MMLLIAAEETAGNRPILRLDFSSFEGTFFDLHPSRDFLPETSVPNIRIRTKGCGARRSRCEFCRRSVERMIINCPWLSDFAVCSVNFVENFEPSSNLERFQKEIYRIYSGSPFCIANLFCGAFYEIHFSLKAGKRRVNGREYLERR